MTTEMVDAATFYRESMKVTRVEFRRGHALEIPLDSGTADVVLSNGSINRCPEKETVERVGSWSD